jgi:hypothetical protein
LFARVLPLILDFALAHGEAELLDEGFSIKDSSLRTVTEEGWTAQ